MSRIYNANKQQQNHEIVRNDTLLNDVAEVITPNRVAANIKLFQQNLNSSNNSSRSSSPKVFNSSAASVSQSQVSKKIDSTSTEEINTKLTKLEPLINSLQEQIPEAKLISSIPAEIFELDEMSQETLNKLITRLEAVATRLETASVSTNGVKSNGVHVASEELDPSVIAFDDLCSNFLKSFITTSTEIGGDVKSIADLVSKAFDFERSFLLEASKCVKPSAEVLQGFYATFSQNIDAITNLREKNRKSEFFNHLSAVSESIGALGWIAVSPAPSPFVKEMNDSAQFYTNRVLKDWREKDAKHVQWVKQWIQLLNELQAYVKQYHTTGVVWNSTKSSATFDASLSKSKSQTTTNGTAPPPPPKAGGPPPPPLPNFTELLAEDPKNKQGSEGSTDALFASINQGTGITSGLKKVSDDMKTHKNPNLRKAAYVPATAKSSSDASEKFASAPVSRPPVFELNDKKWKIEYQNKRNDLVIDKTDMKQTLYVYKCKDCTITVKGKINSISIDSCSKVAVLFDDLLSAFEFINCQSVQMQTLGTVPTVCIEKTDGAQVYLSKKSLNTEVVSSKSSAMNILLPNEEGDEFSEQPVPEQFKTVITPDQKLKTYPTDN